MSPSTIMLDTTPDLEPSGKTASTQRTLLLSPPSTAAHEEKLRSLFSTYDRATTDLQMLDRLSAGLVTLPPATYDLVLVLTDTDGARRAESLQLLASRDVFGRIVPALKAGGRLRSEDGTLGAAQRQETGAAVAREAILAGLVPGGDDGFVKPEYAEKEAVPLRLGSRKQASNGVQNGSAEANRSSGKSSAGPAVDHATVEVAGKATQVDLVPPTAKPAGVGFIDFSDDLDVPEDDDDELIDEDTLLGDEDLTRPIKQPPQCQPKPGQKRRACKDCTCGLAERLDAQDKARRAKADSDLNVLRLKSEDLNEMDFTVKGKVGSCGSCSLGDAFRCEGCPYTGLPPFQPGQEVTILNNVAQF